MLLINMFALENSSTFDNNSKFPIWMCSREWFYDQWRRVQNNFERSYEREVIRTLFRREEVFDFFISFSLINFLLVIRQFIQEGKIQEALPLIKLVSPKLLEENPVVVLMLNAQQFVEYIRSGDTIKAIEYASNYLNSANGEQVYSLSASGVPLQTPIEVIHFLMS